MRVLLTVLLSLTALVAVLVTGVKGTESYTIHIGSRTPRRSWMLPVREVVTVGKRSSRSLVVLFDQ